MSNLLKRWNELAEIKDELAARDWFPGTSGNLSIKVSDSPFSCLVTASGKDKRKRTDEDFLLVGADGTPLEETPLKPSAETGIHLEIYRLTDAGCILHVHTVDNNVISALYAEQGEITFRGQELIKAFGIWEEDGELTVPIVENHADLKRLAKEVGRVITPQTKAVLIRNHGITVWGENGFAAKKHLEALEFLFSYQLKMAILGRLSSDPEFMKTIHA
ncbi:MULTISPECIES: methylthioribulose 1-phosphate dehydratase [Thermoactinomyces]|uniref:Methylthioribulose-1-phosphate dehydratase n=1 Tax=Thermoactinomyces daqus TaxID=1329516 RepID=A0A7W1X9U1_9BACL|nr:methylthioribulose 1-phosphate dehydratase [Thermoactinomyces daqus]MBA4542689.1 methylthioribulose 1-phosphate dehydratase [Thermoactinomyces daqus]MBH8597331.1 methylthioribulose 1-phosphate dehydratase [Thermoactinomyces sp. CICC 10523]MBH8602892.1 methylthioribulose 1-phosphate dehydratase [Thermoactinomyces sp. CICC 10522]MBH8607260.1 methylthioribulose 1-phosphate dehydratase [Thermoactinomyces sp. CICC 10521]